MEKRNRGEHFWRDNENSPLLHTWRGRVVNLCEMKFVNTEFEVKNDYEMKLRERLNWVMAHVSRRHNVQMTLVTTFGLKYGIHCGIFQRVVTLDSLFEH